MDDGSHLACYAQGHDYIGPDPLRWVERLREVSAYSSFTAHEKVVIAHALERLHKDLYAITLPQLPATQKGSAPP